MTKLRSNESGAVLIVALVILALTTLLGVAVMQGATMESKMATSSQERQQAFNSAEAALRQAERHITSIGFSDTDLRSDCTDSTCFNSSCTKGYCFNGTFTASDEQKDCVTVVAGSNPPADGVWADASLNVWNNTDRHIAVDLPGYGSVVAAKYIIEFRCFTNQKDDGSGSIGTVASNTGDIVYRITARGTSRSGRIDAMVQSTFRATAP